MCAGGNGVHTLQCAQPTYSEVSGSFKIRTRKMIAGAEKSVFSALGAETQWALQGDARAVSSTDEAIRGGEMPAQGSEHKGV